MRIQLTVVAVAFGLLMPRLVLAEPSARDWLDRMSHSLRELNYSGVFTYEFGRDMHSVRIVHAVVDGVEHERVVQLNGPLFEVVRDGHDLKCVHGGDSLVRLDHTIPAGPFAKKFGAGIGELDDHYQLAIGNATRVAGRDAVELEIRPRDAFRYGYRLALDRETALLLRALLLDGQQRILERFQFAEVQIGGDPDLAGLKPSSDGYVTAHHLEPQHDAEGSQAPQAWQVRWVPGGFMMAASELQRGPAPTVQSLMYTDGPAVFSVFVEASPSGGSEAGHARRGATIAYTMPVPGELSNVVTVVGEVPLTTARRVANSVRFVSAEAP